MQKSALLIMLLHFSSIYALDVIYICWVYIVTFCINNGLLPHLFSQFSIIILMTQN